VGLRTNVLSSYTGTHPKVSNQPDWYLHERLIAPFLTSTIVTIPELMGVNGFEPFFSCGWAISDS
jgi:hypothetical protein